MGIQLNFLKSAINSFTSDITSSVKSIANDITSNVKSFTNDIGSFASNFANNFTQQVPSILNQIENFAIDFALDKLQSYIDKVDKTLFGYVQAYDRILKQFGGFDLLLQAFSQQAQCEVPPDFLYDPHISGYFYFIFSTPKCMSKYVPENTNRFIGFLAIDVGNSTSQIETSHLTGIGKKVNSMPTARSIDNTLTVTYYDVYNLSVSQFFHRWQDCIIEPRYGLHMYKSLDDFKTSAVVIHQHNTDRVVMDGYFGLYPVSVPTLEQSKSNVGITQKTITFSYDKLLPSLKW